jgi:hypothetical protein
MNRNDKKGAGQIMISVSGDVVPPGAKKRKVNHRAADKAGVEMKSEGGGSNENLPSVNDVSQDFSERMNENNNNNNGFGIK